MGQSFLISAKTAGALVSALGIEPGDTLLEIGPGKGVLTRRLVEQARRVVAVEIDVRLVKFLRQELPGCASLEIVHQDFLDYEFDGLGQVKVIGNLPYSVSSQILFRLLEFRERWTRAVLTTQREFANRVLAGPGTKAYGALSVFLDRVSTRKKLFSIPASCFRPRPEIVSTAFRLERREQPLFEPADEELFRRVVKACFGQRRKTLANNVAHGLGLAKEQANRLLEESGIVPGARAETLSSEQFRELYETVSRQQAGT